MKKIIILFFLIIILSCSSRMYSPSSFEGKRFESNRGPLYLGNQIWFARDGAFKYIGHGPSVFISIGYWRFDSSKREIELTSEDKFNYAARNSVDTMWVDLSHKRIKIKSPEEIVFERLIYKYKDNEMP